MSGSGAESGDGEVTAVEPPKPLVEEKKKKEVVVPTNTTTPHQHHHHHHHHHRHHRHHAEKIEKKTVNSTSEMEGIDWSAIKNNTKVVGRIAQEANIPVKKLLAIFRSGASRSDIAKQTEELLNRTIESQADLAQLFENEEEESEEKKHSKKKKETGKYIWRYVSLLIQVFSRLWHFFVNNLDMKTTFMSSYIVPYVLVSLF